MFFSNISICSMFQSTRPRGRTRHILVFYHKYANKFQSTRPRGRTRLSDCWLLLRLHRFQSTRPRGRTRQHIDYQGADLWSFNPRVLAGGRDFAKSSRNCFFFVSIHASSREDATIFHSKPNKRKRFQSTRPRGRTRQILMYSILRIGGFNPRVLAGGRDQGITIYDTPIQFQSTRPRGRTRRAPQGHFRNGHVSIHASSREDATAKRRE